MTWQACRAPGGDWWITDGPWEPGHPESIKARTNDRDMAEQIAAEHNGSGRMRRCWKCQAVQPATFGELVKGWRGEFTLKEAGEKCDVSGSALSRMENGDLPDLRSFIKLVDATGVDPEFALLLVRSQLPSAPEQPAAEQGAGA